MIYRPRNPRPRPLHLRPNASNITMNSKWCVPFEIVTKTWTRTRVRHDPCPRPCLPHPPLPLPQWPQQHLARAVDKTNNHSLFCYLFLFLLFVVSTHFFENKIVGIHIILSSTGGCASECVATLRGHRREFWMANEQLLNVIDCVRTKAKKIFNWVHVHSRCGDM